MGWPDEERPGDGGVPIRPTAGLSPVLKSAARAAGDVVGQCGIYPRGLWRRRLPARDGEVASEGRRDDFRDGVWLTWLELRRPFALIRTSIRSGGKSCRI